MKLANSRNGATPPSIVVRCGGVRVGESVIAADSTRDLLRRIAPAHRF